MKCHVCHDETLLACADCKISFNADVYVCKRSECRNSHEKKCPGDDFPKDNHAWHCEPIGKNKCDCKKETK